MWGDARFELSTEITPPSRFNQSYHEDIFREDRLTMHSLEQRHTLKQGNEYEIAAELAAAH